LARIRDYYAQFPFVRRTAIAVGNPSGDNDEEALFKNLCRFVRQRVRYVNDPRGFEHLTAPDVMLGEILQPGGQGVAYGDCDCHVTLLNTLLCSVGFQTGFCAVKLPPAGALFDHVVSVVEYKGLIVTVDPCAKHTPAPTYLDRFIVW